MKSFKKKVSKILLPLTMVFAMVLTIMPTNVFAATYPEPNLKQTTKNVETVKLLDLLFGSQTKIKAGTIITWTADELKQYDDDNAYNQIVPFMGNGSTTFFDIMSLSKVYAGKNRLREQGYKDGEYIVPSNFPTDMVTAVGTVDEWEIVRDDLNFRLTHAASTIDFNSNGGTASMDSIYVVGENSVTLPSCEFTAPSGKVFKNWSVNGQSYNSGANIIVNSNMTITAEWKDKPSHTHTPATTWSKDDTNHWHECTANDGEKMDLASHTFGDWVIDTPATDTTKGSKHRDCTVCGQREIVEIPATGVTPEKPVIIAGAGSTHQISNGKDMTLTCSGKLEDLTGVYVDGKLVDASNYTLKSGSTILTLKTSYLDTLSAGKHTLKFQYKDNISAETDFTITAKEAPKNELVIKDTASPKTGDNSYLVIYAFLLLLSGCAVVAVTYKRKKSINN